MGVIIGMDPHQRSATIEVVDERGQVLATGRFATDAAGYKAMLAEGRRFTTPRRRRSHLLPAAQSRRHALDDGHASTQTPTIQPRLRPHA